MWRPLWLEKYCTMCAYIGSTGVKTIYDCSVLKPWLKSPVGLTEWTRPKSVSAENAHGGSLYVSCQWCYKWLPMLSDLCNTWNTGLPCSRQYYYTEQSMTWFNSLTESSVSNFQPRLFFSLLLFAFGVMYSRSVNKSHRWNSLWESAAPRLAVLSHVVK